MKLIPPEELERRRLRHLETNRLWKLENHEKVKAQAARYRNKYREILRERGAKHYALNGKKHTERQKAWLIKWRYDNWEKVLAECKLQRAVKSGRVSKPGCCQTCGRQRKIHGHHDDYSKPLDVKWLCSSCHRLLHLAIDKKKIL